MDWKGRTFFRRLLCLILILSCPATATAQLSAQSVQETIDDAIAAIWKNQNPIRGTWPDFGHYEGGATALCVLALLNAGVPVEDPRIDLALRQLADINSKFVYVVSLQTMVSASPLLSGIEFSFHGTSGGWRRLSLMMASTRAVGIMGTDKASDRIILTASLRFWR